MIHEITGAELHEQFKSLFQNLGSPVFSPYMLAEESNLLAESNGPGVTHLPNLEWQLPGVLGGG